VAVGLDGLEAGLLLKGGHGCFAGGVLEDGRRVRPPGGQPSSLYVLLRASALLDGQVARSGLVGTPKFPMGRLDGTSEKRAHGCAWPVNRTASERGGGGGGAGGCQRGASTSTDGAASPPAAAVRRSARVGRTAASHAGVAFCVAIRQADALQRCDALTKSSCAGSVGFSLPLHQPFTTDTQPASRRPRQPTLHLWATRGPRPSFRKVQRSRTSGDGVEGEGLAWGCVATHRRARKPPKPWHSALSTQTRMGDAGAHGGASPSSRQQGGPFARRAQPLCDCNDRPPACAMLLGTAGERGTTAQRSPPSPLRFTKTWGTGSGPVARGCAWL
jgi:hypothetical protein